jgi:hypothetical protein
MLIFGFLFVGKQAKTPSAPLDAGRSFAETIQVMISVKLINSVSSSKNTFGSLGRRKKLCGDDTGNDKRETYKFCIVKKKPLRRAAMDRMTRD